MKKIWIWLCVCWLIGTVPVLAHVQNEKNLYSDIEFSTAKEEIVILHGIRAIALEGGANLYKPFELLTLSDLAFWAGNFKSLGGDGATADDIRQAALAEGLVPALEGNATYGDVNQAYFAGAAPVDDASATLSREEFALYMGRFFSEAVNGETLFDMADYEAGPTGHVDEVEKTAVTEGGSTYDVFRISVDGEWVQVSHHPKILNGPVDLTQWKDKYVEASWYAPGHAGEERELEIIKVGEEQFTPEEIGAVAETPTADDTTEPAEGDAGNTADREEGVGEPDSGTVETGPADTTADEEERNPGSSVPVILIVGGGILVLLAVWLFRRK